MIAQDKRIFLLNKYLYPLVIALLCVLFRNQAQADQPHTTAVSQLLRSEAIESQIQVNLLKTYPNIKKGHLNIICFNGVVLLTGEVTDIQSKFKIGQIARRTEQVRRVYNELQVIGTTSYLSRLNDTWITTKVRTKILLDKKIKGSNLLVTSNNGQIYLLGNLSPAQANAAVKLAQQSDGVQGVTDLIQRR